VDLEASAREPGTSASSKPGPEQPVAEERKASRPDGRRSRESTSEKGDEIGKLEASAREPGIPASSKPGPERPVAGGDESGKLEALCGTVASAERIDAVGARTQWHVGGPPPNDAVHVRAPAGVVRYEPDDLTITVGAGTTFRDLSGVLAEHGQECPLDPESPDATVGGVLVCGLSGPRRLRLGPLRDHVLELRFVTADGRLVKAGGPTVKNVTGYDLVRLLIGSFGTLGVLVQATLRCRPRPAAAQWFEVDDMSVPAQVFRPSCCLWDGTVTRVLLEGAGADVATQGVGLRRAATPARPEGPHRGRISVAPAAIAAVGEALERVDGVRWCAELGVGTAHVATDIPASLDAARAVAHDHGGWLLREEGGDPTADGFGRPLPNIDLMRRIKAAFDPTGKLARGRLPL
jgi:glycolate dehydrogenase FAD-binding subunit